MIDINDNDIFENQGTITASIYDVDMLTYIYTKNPNKVDDVEDEESTLSKWENGAHSIDNIIGDVE